MILKKLASTRNTFNGQIPETIINENALHDELLKKNQNTDYTFPRLSDPTLGKIDRAHQYNVCDSIQWCNDGGSFVTTSEDCGLRLYITSPTLLEDDDEQLVPFLRVFRPSSIICSRIHPTSSIYNGFCASMIATTDVPLRFMSLIPDENGVNQTLMTYQTQNEQTEKFLKLHCLEFLDSTTFATGSHKLISIFDVNRANPLLEFKSKAGITSCITKTDNEFSTANGFYTGSFSNKIQLFDTSGEVLQSVSLRSGNGITQLLESSNGKYIYVVSRNSNKIDILDIRMGLKQICQLDGFSSGNQRLKGDVLPNSQGLVIGTDRGDLLWYKDAEMGIECQPDTVQLCDESIPCTSINPREPSVLAIGRGDRTSDKSQVSLQQLTIGSVS